MFKDFVVSRMSEISLTDSPRNLPATYAVWSWLIKDERTDLNLSAKTFESNLASKLIKLIGLRFFIKRLSLPLSSFVQLVFAKKTICRLLFLRVGC